MFLQKWILNLQDLPRSQSPETVPICIAWKYFPHDNIVCTHLCVMNIRNQSIQAFVTGFGPFCYGTCKLVY